MLVEMTPARHRRRSNVNDAADVGLLDKVAENIPLMRGVPNGEDGGAQYNTSLCKQFLHKKFLIQIEETITYPDIHERVAGC